MEFRQTNFVKESSRHKVETIKTILKWSKRIHGLGRFKTDKLFKI